LIASTKLQDIGTRNWSIELRLLRDPTVAQASGRHSQE
jgi:hypothetical protein